jgi:hypothetical protein
MLRFVAVPTALTFVDLGSASVGTYGHRLLPPLRWNSALILRNGFSNSRTVRHYIADYVYSGMSDVDSGNTVYSDGIFEQSMGASNRVGIGLSYRPEAT